jgi:hypothetical protein
MAQHLFAGESSSNKSDLDGNFSELYAVKNDVNRATKAWSLFGTPTLATDGSYYVLQINGGASLSDSGGTSTLLGCNLGGTPSVPTRIAAGNSTSYLQTAGVHVFNTSVTGAAGASISFVEISRMTAGGQWLVGVTTPYTGNLSRNCVHYLGASTEYGVSINTPATTGRALNFLQGGNSSGGGTITQVGSVTITTTATAYNTSSDYRLKENFTPIPAAASGAFIDALNPGTFGWKVNGSPGAGFLAHELQAVSPSSVVGDKDAEVAIGNLVDSNSGSLISANVPQPAPVPDGQAWSQTGSRPEYQAVEYGSAEVIAMMVAELKSLRARLAAAGIA